MNILRKEINFSHLMNKLRANIWLILILTIGLGLRLYEINLPLLDLKPHREIHTAEETRNFYFDGNLLYPKTKLWADEPGYYLVEFPLYNAIVAQLYQINGSVNETWGRLVSVVSSLGVAIFFYLFTKQYFGQPTALWSLTFFYLLSPQEIVMSRSFQPDQFGLLLGFASLYFFSLWLIKLKLLPYLVAFATLSLLFLVKISFFPLAFPMLYLAFKKWGRQVFKNIYLGLFFLTLLPALLWFHHVQSVYAAYPNLHSAYLLAPTSWLSLTRFLDFRWYANIFYDFIDQIAPLPVVLLAGFSLFMKKTRQLSLVLAWFGGLLIYAVVFSHNLHFWYYLLPFLFPIAILAGSAISWISKIVSSKIHHRSLLGLSLVIFLLVASFRFYALRIYAVPKKNNSILKTAAAVQRLAPANSKIVASSYNHAALTYYSLRSDLWGATFDIADPTCQGKCSSDRLITLVEWGATLYAISDKQELAANPLFAQYLQENFRQLVAEDGFIIYDLTQTKNLTPN